MTWVVRPGAERLRTVTPHRLFLAVVSALGGAHVESLADLLRTFNHQNGVQVACKAFYNRLARRGFEAFMREMCTRLIEPLRVQTLTLLGCQPLSRDRNPFGAWRWPTFNPRDDHPRCCAAQRSWGDAWTRGLHGCETRRRVVPVRTFSDGSVDYCRRHDCHDGGRLCRRSRARAAGGSSRPVVHAALGVTGPAARDA